MVRVIDYRGLLPPDLYKAVLEKELKKRVRSCKLIKLSRQSDGTLLSFVIRVQTFSEVLFLRRNVGHNMKQVFENHRIMADNLPAGSVPKPFAYIPSIDAVLTREIYSKDFFPLPIKEKERLIGSAGRLLQRVHNLPTRTVQLVRGRPGTLEEILQTSNRNTLRVIQRSNPMLSRRLRAPLPFIFKRERAIRRSGKKTIILGDYHPLNILSRSGQAIMVDLDDLAVGSPWRDVGSMLEQIYSILHHQEPRATLEQIKRYQKIFLKNYSPGKTVDEPLVAFYQAWIAWRNALYFASKFHPSYTMAELSLGRCERFLALYSSLTRPNRG